MTMQAMNAQMVDKLLSAAGEPLEEGGYALRVVETRGRVSGQARKVPLAVVQRDEARFLVSPVRDRDWVRNLLAHPECAVIDGSMRREFRAHLVEDRSGAEVVGQYLRSMTTPWAIAAFPVSPDDALSETLALLPQVAVFELREKP